MSLLRLPKQPLAPHLRDSEFLGYSLAGSEYITPSREDPDLKQCQEVIVIKNKKSQSPQVHKKTVKKVCRWSFSKQKKSYLRESHWQCRTLYQLPVSYNNTVITRKYRLNFCCNWQLSSGQPLATH